MLGFKKLEVKFKKEKEKNKKERKKKCSTELQKPNLEAESEVTQLCLTLCGL